VKRPAGSPTKGRRTKTEKRVRKMDNVTQESPELEGWDKKKRGGKRRGGVGKKTGGAKQEGLNGVGRSKQRKETYEEGGNT